MEKVIENARRGIVLYGNGLMGMGCIDAQNG
jgi:hypothetical protein